MVQRILRVTQNTVFKLRPVQSRELIAAELHSVRAGTTFEIASYAYADTSGDFNGHIKFALKDSSIQGLNTWYVYSGNAQVEFDGKVVYPQEDEETLPILRIAQNTVLKRRPVQSSTLSAEEIFPVEKGQSFTLHSYAYSDSRGDFSSHIKIALRYQDDYIRGLSTWFAYDKHAYVEFDGKVVYPAEDPNLPVLRITANTLLKRRPVQSSGLSADEVYSVPKGTVWNLHSYAYRDAQGSFNGHIKFALRYEQDYVQYKSTWYVYEGHAQVERNGQVVYPIPKAPPAPTPAPAPTPSPSPSPSPIPAPTPAPSTGYRGKSFRLPGNVSTFYTDQPIIPGGSFTWGEATRDATRIPSDSSIVSNIIALARQLQRARNQIGRPFLINSWYRPPAINRAVGGASRSQHLYGSAADIQVSGYSGRSIANAVMLWWPGGVGIYSNMPNVIHLDVGPKRTWGF